jgi:hypothetical protein
LFKLFDERAITDHSCRFCTLLPRCSSMYSADTLPSWHGGHRCLLQSFFLPQQFTGVSRRILTSLPRLSQASLTDSATAFIRVSCQHFATRPLAGDASRFFTRLPQTRQCLLQIRCNAPTCLSVSPADVLLQQSSPVFPADLFKLLLQHLITYSMEQSPSWEANSKLCR